MEPEPLKEKIIALGSQFDTSGMMLGDETDTTEMNLCVLTPDASVAMLIGKMGSNVNEIKAVSGANISFAKKETSAQGSRKCFHVGTVASIAKALYIETALIADLQAGSSCSVAVVVNNNAAGAVIGKGGANLKDVREQTGCHVVMEKMAESNPIIGGRVLTARHQTSVHSATQAVYIAMRCPGFASPSVSDDRQNMSGMAAGGFDMSGFYGQQGMQGGAVRAADVCCMHGKRRGKQNLQMHPTMPGSYMCRSDDPCKGAGGVDATSMASMEMCGLVGQPFGQQMTGAPMAAGLGGGVYNDSANMCAVHGKRRGARNLQPHSSAPGLFQCLETDQCKL